MIIVQFKKTETWNRSETFKATVNGKKWSCDDKRIEKVLNLVQERFSEQDKERVPEEYYYACLMIRRFNPGEIIYDDTPQLPPPPKIGGVEVDF